VEAVTDYATFNALEPVWSRLIEKARIDHPFVRHEWLRTWWSCFGNDHDLEVLLVRQRGEPVGIAPLMSCRRRLCGVPVRQLQFMWNIYAERFDLIVGEHRDNVYHALLAHLADRRDWDLLVMPQVPSGSATLSDFTRIAGEQGLRVGVQPSSDSPYVALGNSWPDYLDTLDRKHRSNLRNREKRLSQLGKVALQVVSTTDGLDEALRDGLALEAAAWKGDAGTAIATQQQTLRFYSELAHAAAAQGSLRLCFLTLDGARIAFGYYLEYASKLYLLKPGYDPRYATYSPSHLLCYFVLRDACERGITEVDFLASPDPWKFKWTKAVRPHQWLYLFPDRMESRLLHWTKFDLMPRLGEKPMLRMLRDTAVDVLRGSGRASAPGASVHKERVLEGDPKLSPAAWQLSVPMEARDL
jgi:CelD/BcsL family acetyltransferase involved in cellulose biosynthesis